MKTKMIKTILTGLLIFCFFTNLQAEDNYEFAIVYNYDNTRLAVAKHTTEYITFDKGVSIFGELIKKVEEMNKEGWEVYNTTACFSQTGFVNGHIYYLRKKIKE